MSAQRDGWRQRWSALVRKIARVESAAAEHALLETLGSAERVCVLAFVNAHAMNSCAADAAFFHALHDADVLLRDGSGLALLYRRILCNPGLNMNGTDFIPKVLARFSGRRVALWGTQTQVVLAAAAECERRFGVEVVSTEHGFEPPAHYLQRARFTQPDLIVLGMGMPKQEQLAAALRAASSGVPLIVCGGAILDFLGGNASRAPRWMRGTGLEWLYRLCREPRRLFTRYVVGNPLFLFKLSSWHRDGAKDAGSPLSP